MQLSITVFNVVISYNKWYELNIQRILPLRVLDKKKYYIIIMVRTSPLDSDDLHFYVVI